MMVPDPYQPLPPDHPSVRDRTICPCCEQPFVAGAVTCLWPTGQPDEHGVCEALLLHHACAVRLTAECARRVTLTIKLHRASMRTLREAQPGDARRLDFLEQRLREHGPDLGYLLGLPRGWTNLRAAVDAALAAPR